VLRRLPAREHRRPRRISTATRRSRLPEIRRLRPYDSPGRDSGTPITVTQHSTPSQTPKHTAVHQHSTLCSDCNGVGVECGVSNNRLVTNREPRQNGVCSDFSEVNIILFILNSLCIFKQDMISRFLLK
jgi:hypothetical protein